MRLLQGAIDPNAPSDAVEPDVLKNPNLHLRLNVEKSKAYVKEILGNMDAKAALKFLHDQVMTKNLLLNDSIISHLELLGDPKLPFAARMNVIQAIQALTASSTQITSTKIALDKALGMNLVPHLPEGAANPNPQTQNREVAAEDFVSMYAEAIKVPKNDNPDN